MYAPAQQQSPGQQDKAARPSATVRQPAEREKLLSEQIQPPSATAHGRSDFALFAQGGSVAAENAQPSQAANFQSSSGNGLAPSISSTPVQLQTKLMVNEPGDIYEQEADRVAEQVMRMPEPAVQLKPT